MNRQEKFPFIVTRREQLTIRAAKALTVLALMGIAYVVGVSHGEADPQKASIQTSTTEQPPFLSTPDTKSDPINEQGRINDVVKKNIDRAIINEESLKYKEGTLHEYFFDANGQKIETEIQNPVVVTHPSTGELYGYARLCTTVVYPFQRVGETTKHHFSFTNPDGVSVEFLPDNTPFAEGLRETGPITPTETTELIGSLCLTEDQTRIGVLQVP